MKLQSMTEKVLELELPKENLDNNFKSDLVEFYNKSKNYANFLKQPLTLGMFFPTDENGNVLHKPTKSIKIIGGVNLTNKK